jgi:type I restriction enzyme S subunit
MREALAMAGERKARVVAWDGPLSTLMGWTYASHGGALAYLQRSWGRRLGDSISEDGLFYGLLRQRTPCSVGFGVPLITQRDALAIRQLPEWIAKPAVPVEALCSPANSIVMAGRGTLGEGELFARPAYITPSLSKYALTQDLLRLVPKPGDEALVYAFLSTLVGRRLLRACAVGTKIMQLRLDLLRQIPLPEIEPAAEARLREHHRAAIASYDAAAGAEAAAVRLIEERVLPAWLG